MTQLLLDERIRADGSSARSWLELVIDSSERIRLFDEADHGGDDERIDGQLPIVALDRVMVRYGKALDESIELTGDVLELGQGRRLRRLHYHSVLDTEGRDYLVWERPFEEPIAVIATMATAALRHLVKARPPSGI